MNSRNDCVEGSLWRECSDVKFVEDILFQGKAEPTIVGPCEVCIHYLGRTVHSLRLKSRSRIRPLRLAVQTVSIECARSDPLHVNREVASVQWLHRDHPIPRVNKVNVN